ncbi:peptidylprolyl isomerase [Desulfosporosinus shakirovi]|uniref:peptidylprolyl isomerase n=1 Tax=Desulfosporosinus shakirovi TaxID=2885154 RepID=UPI001E4BBF50|nr:peptidylprolyl isomerase [Desulfosporosinus sp. SRJS8]MCB8815285.1 peptidylprolyl isomerase [Desulfosporosinus sp. SRJS8]
MTLKKLKTIYVGLFTILLVAVIGIGSVYATQNNIVAKVNGVAISETELQEFLLQQGGSDGLNTLIQQSIIEQEAEKQKIQVTEADIDKELATVKASFDSEEAFSQALATNGITLDTLRTNILTNLQMTRLLEAQNPITEDEIKAYFDTNKDSLDVAEEVNASHILVATAELANEIKAKITAGETFADLAKQYSTDESTKELGGNLGFFAKGEMVQEFEEVAFSLEVGQISDPVKTDYGYHIIKIEARTEAKAATLEESRDKIKEILLAQKLTTEFDPWLQERLAEYTIENYLT